MKILIIDNSSIVLKNSNYSIFRNTGEFGLELKELNNEIEYYQFVSINNEAISTFDLNKNNIKYTYSKIYKSKLLSYLIAYLRGIIRILKNDFVYMYYPNSFSFLLLFCILIKKDYGVYLRGEKRAFSRKSFLIYRFAKVVFTVSDAFSNKIIAKQKKPKVCTIKPMISFGIKDIIENREYTLKDTLKILFLGRIDKEKGMDELIDAIKKLNDTALFKFHLDIVGNGNYLNEIKKKISSYGLEHLVTFHGSIKDSLKIREFYLESDVYILPTYHEGFPRTLYEAMIFGTPIITTFVGGISGLMKDHYNCLKIESHSVESIVNKLIFTFENYSSIETFAKNGTNNIRKLLNNRTLSHASSLHKILNNTSD